MRTPRRDAGSESSPRGLETSVAHGGELTEGFRYLEPALREAGLR